MKGVYANTNGRWQARLTANGKILNFGTYDTVGEATAARRKAEQEHFGEFAA